MESSKKGRDAKENNPFSHNALMTLKISRINGKINEMKEGDLVKALKDLKLNTQGCKRVLKRRLKNFYREEKGLGGNEKDHKVRQYPYLIVIDYEATCEKNAENYPHEIIEFPAVLISTEKLKVVDEFHRYCKPELNPRLTEFCVELTGITQDIVDSADPFPTVLQQFGEWLESHGLGTDHKFAIVTDGPYDMVRFLHGQCCLNELPFPRWGCKWVNARKVFGNSYGHGKGTRIADMLQQLGLKFEGRLHCGLHDARNIARIVLYMLEDLVPLKVNERIKELGTPKEKPKAEACCSPPSSPCKVRPPEGQRGDGGGHDHPAAEEDVAKGASSGNEGSESSADRDQAVVEEDEDDEDSVEDLMRYLAIQKSV